MDPPVWRAHPHGDPHLPLVAVCGHLLHRGHVVLLLRGLRLGVAGQVGETGRCTRYLKLKFSCKCMKVLIKKLDTGSYYINLKTETVNTMTGSPDEQQFPYETTFKFTRSWFWFGSSVKCARYCTMSYFLNQDPWVVLWEVNEKRPKIQDGSKHSVSVIQGKLWPGCSSLTQFPTVTWAGIWTGDHIFHWLKGDLPRAGSTVPGGLQRSRWEGGWWVHSPHHQPSLAHPSTLRVTRPFMSGPQPSRSVFVSELQILW